MSKDGKAPGFWFYTADYERDMQILSLGAQGLWSRMLCWMHENEAHRGFAELPTGAPMTIQDIAAKVGKAVREVEKSIEEMERVGTFSRDDRGCIFCRRMARDTHISAVRSAAAKSRMDTAMRAADGAFCLDVDGTFAPAKPAAKEEQNPSVTASVSDSVSDSSKNLLSAADAAAPPLALVPPPWKPSESWWQAQHARWYAGYWCKRDKADSLKAFRKRVCALVHAGMAPDEAIEFLIREAAKDRMRFEPTEDWEWRIRLHPATWLNGKRWEDEPTAQARDSPGFRRQSTAEAMLDRAEELMHDGL